MFIGINFIFYYGTTFFVRSGIKDPYLISVLTNVVNVAATLPAFMLIERAGRRPLLIWGAFFLAVFQLVIAIAGVTLSVTNITGQRMLVAFVFLYVSAFAVSWGPIAWVLNAEMFPLAVRAKGISMTNACNWAVNFAIGYSVPYLVNEREAGGAGLGARVYFLWGSLSIFCCLYACRLCHSNVFPYLLTIFFAQISLFPRLKVFHLSRSICYSSIQLLAGQRAIVINSLLRVTSLFPITQPLKLRAIRKKHP